MSSQCPTIYKTISWWSYNDSLKRRGSLSFWFDQEMVWVPPPSGKCGRQQNLSDAVIQACLNLKMLFGLSLRQATGFVQNLLRPTEQDWAAPDFSILRRRQGSLIVNLPYRGGIGPLNLLIDSTGINAEGEGEWNARKHVGSKRRIWRKIHIGIDEETLGVRAVEVTGSNIGDAPVLPDLLNQIAPRRHWQCHRRRSLDTRKCQTRETDERRCYRSERRGQRTAICGTRCVATLERIPPTKPHRNQDALPKTDGAISHGTRLLQAGRRDSNPCRRSQSLYCAWHTCH